MLVSDEAAAGSDLVATSYALAKGLEREGADLVLFGQQSSDSDGAVLWAAVADRLQRPVISQVADLTVDASTVTGKRQTEFGYDVISAPLPAVVAVSDAINEPRYPSLKGIMGAKSKPTETLALADIGVDAGSCRRRRLADERARARAASREGQPGQDRGRRLGSGAARRLARREEAALSTLVFLEHHDGVIQKGVTRRSRTRARRRWRRGGRRGRARRGRRCRVGRARTAYRPCTPSTRRSSRRRSRSRASMRSRRSLQPPARRTSSLPPRSSRPTSRPASRRDSTRGSTGTSRTSPSTVES